MRFTSGGTLSLVHLHSHAWWADASWKRTSIGRAGLNPRGTLGLESHLGPVRRWWLYCIGPRIIETHKPYHDDNVGTQSAGGIISVARLVKLSQCDVTRTAYKYGSTFKEVRLSRCRQIMCIKPGTRSEKKPKNCTGTLYYNLFKINDFVWILMGYQS